jgi:hypothetical protein
VTALKQRRCRTPLGFRGWPGCKFLLRFTVRGITRPHSSGCPKRRRSCYAVVGLVSRGGNALSTSSRPKLLRKRKLCGSRACLSSGQPPAHPGRIPGARAPAAWEALAPSSGGWLVAATVLPVAQAGRLGGLSHVPDEVRNRVHQSIDVKLYVFQMFTELSSCIT